MIKENILKLLRGIFQNPYLEKILVLYTQQQKYGSWMKIIVPNHYQYKSPSIRTCRRNGINYELDISDMIDWYVYFGFREIEKENFFMSLQKGDVILDIGANLGQFTLNCAQKVQPEGLVLSFEPDQENYLKLKKNIDLNHFQNIQCFPLALGEFSGNAEMKIVDPHNKGMNKIENNDHGNVLVMTLDEFLKENKIEKLDKIKIDTEGYELHILKGGKNTLQKFHPMLFLEIDERNLLEQNAGPAELFKFLDDLGYKIYFPGNFERVEINRTFENCHFDIIAH